MSCARLLSHRSLYLVFALALVAFSGCEDRNAAVDKEWKDLQKEAKLVEPNKNPRIEIKLQKADKTDLTLVVELLEDSYPQAVNRFIALLQDGYYNDRMQIHVAKEEDKDKISQKPQIQFMAKTNVSASGFNAVYLNQDKPETGTPISHLSEGKLSVPKVPDPRCYGMLITREADPSLDSKFIPIGVVIAGEGLGSITDQTTIKEIKYTRLSREAAQYALTKGELPIPVAMVEEPKPLVEIDTPQGKIKVELDEDAAPNTVGNFIYLAQKGFYDNGMFHRVEDWVVQGGDPHGDDPKIAGQGGPGYQFKNEINWDSLGLSDQQKQQLAQAGFQSTAGLKSLHNDSGMISMAHAGPGTNGSQFFFVRGKQDARFLDGKHTAFGKVIEGMDVINGFKNGTPVKINSIKVLRKRGHKYVDGAHGPSYEPEAPAAPTGAIPAPMPAPAPAVMPAPAPAPAPVPAPAPTGTAPAPAPMPAPAPAPAPKPANP